MDCDLFDQQVMDALYGELDELSLAAVRRHVDGCQRCHASWAGLRATRDLAVLAPVPPPEGLEARILAAASAAHASVPIGRRFGRAISWAGGWAMRPQAAMAALLVLVLGSSFMLLRGKPDRAGSASRVSVTEHGVPEATEEIAAVVQRVPTTDTRPAAQAHGARRDEDRPRAAPEAKAAVAANAEPEAPPSDDRSRASVGAGAALAAAAQPEVPAAPRRDDAPSEPAPARDAGASPTDDRYASAMALYRAGAFGDAARELGRVADQGGANAAQAALFAARAVESSRGCAAAVAAYEAAASRFSGSNVAGDATWAAARCLRATGANERARELFTQLRTTAGFRDRAEAELGTLPAPAPAPTTKAAQPHGLGAARPAH